MENKSHSSLWQELLGAAIRPARLGLLLLALLLLTDPSALPLGLLGMLFYLALVVRALKPSREGAGEPPAESEPNLPAEYQSDITSGETTRQRIDAAIDGSDPALAHALAPIKRQVEEVTRLLHTLTARAQGIDAFLAREKREYIEKDLAGLEEAIAASSDSFTRAQYEQARRHREEQLHDHDELTLCRQRVHAQITNVLASLDGLEAKILKMQTTDLRDADLMSDTVACNLQSLSQEMAAFQESVDATMALRIR